MTPESSRRRAERVRTLLSSAWGIEASRLRCLSASDTTVYRVDTRSERFALRLHGAHADGEIESVALWLTALRDTDVRAPEPVPARDGRLVVDRATVVRWLPGRIVARSARPVHYQRLGRTMAQLHEHAGSWSRPDGFTRPEWAAADVFCERGVAAPAGADIWSLVPDDARAVLRDAADRTRAALDDAPRMLIHADLHLWNVLFADGRACPFDFDDTAFGAPLYDVASALSERRFGDDWQETLDAFARGYESVRPQPDLGHLDTFIAARLAGLALWAVSMAETLPAFREPLPRWLRTYATQLRRLDGGRRDGRRAEAPGVRSRSSSAVSRTPEASKT